MKLTEILKAKTLKQIFLFIHVAIKRKKYDFFKINRCKILKMKKCLLSIILGLLITSAALARSTGCKEGNCENGYGKWVYTDKTTYEGEWIGTKKHGQGTETWPNGYIYKGEFKDSLWSGFGTLSFPDSSTYEGQWANGFMNGKGTFTWADGTQKTGIWKNGKLQE